MTTTETQYARSHKWDEDGDTVEGTFLRWEEGQTKDYGPKPIVILDSDTGEVGIWLMQTALFARFRDEVKKRPGQELTVGERIIVTRGPMKKAEGSDRKYRSFTVKFPDAPPASGAALLGLTPAADPVEGLLPDGPGEDDDVPF